MNKYTLFFGDSFVGVFKLFNNKKFKTHRFPGVSMKGVGKPTNETRQKIESIIHRYKPEQIDGIVFCFGNVDVEFSYYYCKYYDIEFNMKTIIRSYIDFINTTTRPDTYPVYIIAPYPPPTRSPEMKYIQLLRYNIFKNDIPESVQYILKNPRKMIDKLKMIYNKLRPLLKDSSQRKVQESFLNTMKTQIEDTPFEMIDVTSCIETPKGNIRKKFENTNTPWSVHYSWEEQLPFFMKKLDRLGLSKENLIPYKKRKEQEMRYKELKNSIKSSVVDDIYNLIEMVFTTSPLY